MFFFPDFSFFAYQKKSMRPKLKTNIKYKFRCCRTRKTVKASLLPVCHRRWSSEESEANPQPVKTPRDATEIFNSKMCLQLKSAQELFWCTNITVIIFNIYIYIINWYLPPCLNLLLIANRAGFPSSLSFPQRTAKKKY